MTSVSDTEIKHLVRWVLFSIGFVTLLPKINEVKDSFNLSNNVLFVAGVAIIITGFYILKL